MTTSRRNFIKKAAASSALLTLGGALPGFSAASYSRIIGANDRVLVAGIGVGDRGNSVITDFARQSAQCEVIAVCDVDKQVMDKCIANVTKAQTRTPKGEKDMRKLLENKQIDAVMIATPDHWHVPAALLSMQAGKHTYVEKPLSHNPREGEMMVEATAKYNKVFQHGTGGRSSGSSKAAVKLLREGVIGKIHFAKSWYFNDRPSIGIGKQVPVPDWLDWNLWQGPAPRTLYKDNFHPYNWHWFWHWGTAESANNGVHRIDLMRWAMNLDYPVKVSSTGGRLYFKDDWETPDTQVINLEFADGVFMLWEGYSCSGPHGIGIVFYGDKGSLSLSNGYQLFDKENKLVRDYKTDLLNQNREAQAGEQSHVVNFLDAITKGAPVNAPVDEAYKSTLLMLLGNIALRTGRTLNINPANGHIINDSEAQKFWHRSYEPGWEPKV